MKILFLISTLGLGGAEKQLVAWADILQRELGARVSVASFDEMRTERLGALEEVGVPVLIAGRDQSTPNRVRRVVSFAKDNRPDVVHAFSFYLSPLAVMTATVLRATPAASFQGDGVLDTQGMSTSALRSVFAFVKYFTSNSHEAIARVGPRINSRALLQYVPNLVVPCDEQLATLRPASDERSVAALVVGRLDDNKRVGVFLRALALARESEPRLCGVIVGDGPARPSLESQAASLHLLPHGVSFLGQVADPSSSYARADIFVHSAASEGTPNVVLEAMAAGLPVVTTGAGDLCRIISPGRNGLLVAFDDPAATAHCLVSLARAPEIRARLGQQARVDALRLFSVENVRDSLLRFYAAAGHESTLSPTRSFAARFR